jgi:phosphatidylserine synthase
MLPMQFKKKQIQKLEIFLLFLIQLVHISVLMVANLEMKNTKKIALD